MLETADVAAVDYGVIPQFGVGCRKTFVAESDMCLGTTNVQISFEERVPTTSEIR